MSESNGHAESAQLDSPKKAAFLAAYAEIGSVAAACRAADVARQSHYNWLKEPEYKQAFTEAHENAVDALEEEARKRAVEGWDEPVFYEGMICGHKRKFSDMLLAMLLNGNRPEKYRKQQVEHSGPDGGPMQVEAVRMYVPDNGRGPASLPSLNGTNGVHTNGNGKSH